MWTELSWLGIGVHGSRKYQKGSSGHINDRKYDNQLNNCHFLKKDCAPRIQQIFYS